MADTPLNGSAGNLTALRAAKQEWSARLLQPPAAQGAHPLAARAFAVAAAPDPERNVVGVGIGEKTVQGQPTGVRALKFLVRIKYPESQLSTQSTLPKMIDGLPTDVEQVGLFRRFKTSTRNRPAAAELQTASLLAPPNPRTKMRPARPGSSIGFEDPNHGFTMAGTFGAVVRDSNGTYILSNNHVLADEDQLQPGAAIFQPGLLDGGNAATDQIAELTRAIHLQAAGLNKVDCAIARAMRSSLVSRSILFIGRPRGTAAAQIDMIVHKFGRTTGYTVGRVTSIDTDVRVQYEVGDLTFENQIIIVGLGSQPFSDAGDSGSLILTRGSDRAIGLLFAGSTSHTIANHIQDVLQALQVTLM